MTNLEFVLAIIAIFVMAVIIYFAAISLVKELEEPSISHSRRATVFATSIPAICAVCIAIAIGSIKLL